MAAQIRGKRQSRYTILNLSIIALITFPAMSEQSFHQYFRSPIAWLIVAAVVIISGVFYAQNERENARQQFERERIASEQAELRRTKEAEERRVRESQRILDEIRAQKEAEDAQRQEAIAIRQSDVQNKQFVADDRYVSPQQSAYQSYLMQQDQWRRDSDDRKQRYEDESNLRKARADVERQMRFLQQREYEETSARTRREAAARYGR